MEMTWLIAWKDIFRSDRRDAAVQWGDIIAVMRVQQPNLEWDYLNRWAEELKVRDLLERARTQAEALL